MSDFNMIEVCELAGIPSELVEEDRQEAIQQLSEQEGGDTSGVIKALRDTDYRDKDAFFKLAQLIKGLASVADKDELAKKYLSAVSDVLTGVGKKFVKGE